MREKLPERSIDMNAPLMDAQIMLRKEECVLDTEQRLNINDAAKKDAPNTLIREECA